MIFYTSPAMYQDSVGCMVTQWGQETLYSPHTFERPWGPSSPLYSAYRDLSWW